MHSELVAAIKQHITAGRTKDGIRNDVLAAGYSNAEFEAAYAAASPREIPRAGRTPIPPATSSATTPSRSLSTPTQTNNTVQVILNVLVILTLLIGGALAYSRGWIPSVSWFSSAPYDQETLVPGVLRQLSTIDNADFALSTTITPSPREQDVYPLPRELMAGDADMEEGMELWEEFGSAIPPDFQLDLTLNGTVTNTDAEFPNTRLQFAGAVDTNDFGVNVDFEFMSFGRNEFFARVNRVPSLFFDLSPIKGKWISFDIENDLGIPLVEHSLRRVEDDAESDREQVRALVQTVLRLNEKHTFIKFMDDPVRGELREQTAYRYHIGINPDTAATFYNEVLAEVAQIADVSDEELAEARDQIGRYSNQAYVEYYNQHAPIYLWVNEAGMPLRVLIDSRVVLEDDVVTELAGRQINIPVTFDLLAVNDAVTLSKPTAALTLPEAAKALGMERYLDTPRTPGGMQDAIIKQQLSNARSQAEIYYNRNGMSYDGVCTSPDMMELLTEVGTECNDSANAYAINAPLSNGGYYCIDVTGRADDIQTSIGSAVSCDTRTDGSTESKSGGETSSNAAESPVTIAETRQWPYHSQGPNDASVVILEYIDLDDPFSADHHSAVKALFRGNSETGDLRWVRRHLPLTQLHPNAQRLAEAAECVAAEGGDEAYFTFTELLLTERSRNEPNDLSRLPEFYTRAGVSSSAVAACVARGDYANIVTASQEEAVAFGARGTPTTVLLSADRFEVVVGAGQVFEMQSAINTLLGR